MNSADQEQTDTFRVPASRSLIPKSGQWPDSPEAMPAIHGMSRAPGAYFVRYWDSERHAQCQDTYNDAALGSWHLAFELAVLRLVELDELHGIRPGRPEYRRRFSRNASGTVGLHLNITHADSGDGCYAVVVTRTSSNLTSRRFYVASHGSLRAAFDAALNERAKLTGQTFTDEEREARFESFNYYARQGRGYSGL